MYERSLIAGWGDMDFNGHMRNTAYLDKSADLRMMFFAEHGFPMAEFMRLRLGPVVMKDEVEYFREFHLLDEVAVCFEMAGLSPDCSRMKLRNTFFRQGQLAARVTSTGGWFDLAARRLVCPPGQLAELLRAVPRSEDYAELVNSTR